jgi:hypothetical protein
MNRRLRIAALGALAVGVAIQLVPIDRSLPPVESEIPAPPEVRAILERSCYDCHSYETAWPWYGYVAPVSWLLAYDVREGRKHLNFSAWGRYTPKKQAKRREEIPEEVDEGNMPLWYYLPLHPEARLDDVDREMLRRWALDGP